MIDVIDINKIVVSNKVSFGKKDSKYVITYKDAPVCIFLPKNGVYMTDFDKNKCWTKDEKILKKYNDIWQKLVSKKNLVVTLLIISNI